MQKRRAWVPLAWRWIVSHSPAFTFAVLCMWIDCVVIPGRVSRHSLEQTLIRILWNANDLKSESKHTFLWDVQQQKRRRTCNKVQYKSHLISGASSVILVAAVVKVVGSWRRGGGAVPCWDVNCRNNSDFDVSGVGHLSFGISQGNAFASRHRFCCLSLMNMHNWCYDILVGG